MTIKLMSALPNSLLAQPLGYTVTVTSISEGKAKDLLSSLPWQSCIGHQSTAFLFSERLEADILVNRVEVEYGYNDVLLVGLFTPSRRLPEGQLWTEQEILAMDINWTLVQRHLTECVNITESDYTVRSVIW